MKRQTGIWIDTSKAIIVTLDGGKEEKITEIDSEVENSVYHNKEGHKGTFNGGHHSDNEKKFDNRKKEQINYYLEAVLPYVKNADEVYIFGPAGIKIELEKKINSEKSIEAGKLKAVETADSMTLNEIVAKVKKFYAS